ncbi:MAG TPA: S24 family peptidase, partial [Gemmataceae bacterium]|nr:S24 family peptidase [Gemmataceae bacterium]
LFEGQDHFLLQVSGQSMIEDHIDDGDYVVIQKQEVAANGERVVAMVNDEVTLKRFYKEPDHIRLEPANGTMDPIIVGEDSDAKVLGVLIGVVRKV